jgi:hypothetical protein
VRTVQGNLIGAAIDGSPLSNAGAVTTTGDGATLVGGAGELGNRIVRNALATGGAAATILSRTREGSTPETAQFEVVGNVVTGNAGGSRYLGGLHPTFDAEPFAVTTATSGRNGSSLVVSGSFALAVGETGLVRYDVYGATSCEQGQTGGPLLGSTTELEGPLGPTRSFAASVPWNPRYTHVSVAATYGGITSEPLTCLAVPVPSTTTAASYPAGTTEVDVASNDDFAPGDHVVVDPGGPTEEHGRVAALASIIFTAPLRFAHPAGTTIRVEAPRLGDATAPSVRVTRPRSGAAYAVGSRVEVKVTCADAGVGVAGCRHPRLLDTSSPGQRVLAVRAWDANGNLRTVRVPYRVVAGQVRLRAVDPTPKAGKRARLVARVPDDVGGRYRIVVKALGADKALEVCAKARRCAVWAPRRSGQASYVAILRSTGRKHRVLARSEPVVIRWS